MSLIISETIREQNLQSVAALEAVLIVLRDRGEAYKEEHEASRKSGEVGQAWGWKKRMDHNDLMIQMATQLLICY